MPDIIGIPHHFDESDRAPGVYRKPKTKAKNKKKLKSKIREPKDDLLLEKRICARIQRKIDCLQRITEKPMAWNFRKK